MQQKVKQYYNSLKSKKFALYFLRWQISAWIMLPFMMLLESNLPLWANLMVGQAIGSFIFWEIDNFIFKPDK